MTVIFLLLNWLRGWFIREPFSIKSNLLLDSLLTGNKHFLKLSSFSLGLSNGLNMLTVFINCWIFSFLLLFESLFLSGILLLFSSFFCGAHLGPFFLLWNDGFGSGKNSGSLVDIWGVGNLFLCCAFLGWLLLGSLSFSFCFGLSFCLSLSLCFSFSGCLSVSIDLSSLSISFGRGGFFSWCFCWSFLNNSNSFLCWCFFGWSFLSSFFWSCFFDCWFFYWSLLLWCWSWWSFFNRSCFSCWSLFGSCFSWCGFFCWSSFLLSSSSCIISSLCGLSIRWDLLLLICSLCSSFFGRLFFILYC